MEAVIRGHLDPAVEQSRGRISMDEVFSRHSEEMVQIFVAVDTKGEIVGAVVTEVIEWGSGRKSMKILLAGGYGGILMGLVEPMMGIVEGAAMLAGCSSVMVDGRKGWERVLPDGYEFSHCVFEKEL